ncbi:MAG: tyrosine-type recombinase/integrase [Elusimicrobiota bacterium]
MKFRKLMNSAPGKPRKKRHNWTLDESKYLAKEEIRKLRRWCINARDNAISRYEYLPVRDWFMVEVGLNAGLRVAEMANMKCSDLFVNDEKCSMSVVGKGHKKRTIVISKFFKKCCQRFLDWKHKMGQSINPDSYVLTKENNRKLTTRALQKAFKRCMARAGLASHYSIHCLRHTYGSHLYVSSGHNLRLVQEQLGHSSVRVTEVYASVMNSDAKKAVEKLYR